MPLFRHGFGLQGLIVVVIEVWYELLIKVPQLSQCVVVVVVVVVLIEIMKLPIACSAQLSQWAVVVVVVEINRSPIASSAQFSQGVVVVICLSQYTP